MGEVVDAGPGPGADRARPGTGTSATARLGIAGAIFLLALLVRFFFLSQLDAYPRFEKIRNSLDDQVVFHLWAEAVAEGRDFDVKETAHEWAYWSAASPGVYPQSPLYPWWISLIYRLAGNRAFDPVRGAQMLLGALASVGLFYLAGRFTGVLPSTCAGLGLAFYGPQVFYEATFLRAGLLTSLLVFAALAVVRATERTTPLRGLTAGLSLGLLALLRPNMLLVGIALLAWLAWHLARRQQGDGEEDGMGETELRWRRILIWAGFGLLLPLLPIVMINSWRGGGPAFLSSNGPINLFLGNIHDASGLSASPTPTYEAVKAKGLAGEVDLLAELGRDIVQNPGTFMALQWRKLFAFFDPLELPNNLSFHMARKANPTLGWAFLGLHHLLPWAFCGLCLALLSARRGSGADRGGEASWAVFAGLLLGALAAATIPFFVLGRLRLPVIVPLLLFGAMALEGLWRLWRGAGKSERGERRSRFPGRLLGVGLGIGAILLGFWLRPPAPAFRPVDYLMAAAAEETVGDERHGAGDVVGAWKHYGRALALNPDHGKVIQKLAVLARTHPRQAPPFPLEAQEASWLGQEAARRGELDEAERLFRRAARQAPEHPAPRRDLAKIFLLMGDPGRAMEQMELAIERDPTSPSLLQFLRELRARQGRLAGSQPLWAGGDDSVPDKIDHPSQPREIMIRPARPEDAAAFCAIYNPYVASSIITFEEEAVAVDEMATRVSRVSAQLPWLVFEEGRILGYAYATPWKGRAAYRFAVETTVYMDPAASGRGLGTRLYRELLDRLGELGAHCALGGIALPNDASVALHEKLGFVKVGELKEVGFKLDRWVDVGYWQRML